jgi:hypothetical protein
MTQTIAIARPGKLEVNTMTYCKVHKITYRYFCPRCQREKRYKRYNLKLLRMPYGPW